MVAVYSPSSGLLLHREEHSADRVCELERPDGCRVEPGPEVGVRGRLQEDELPPATGAWDAWDGAHLDATGAPGHRALVDAGAGKLAVRGQADRVQDVLPPRLELQLALRAAPA